MSLIQVSRPVSTSQLLGCVPNCAELLSITNVQSCEFGACGPGPTGFSPSSVGANFSQIKIDPQAAFFFGALWYGTSGRNGHVHGLWHYGNFCGAGGEGLPTNNTDTGCMFHDYCYFQGGFTFGSNFQGFNAQLQACNQLLCNGVRTRANQLLNQGIVNQGPFSPLGPEYGADSDINYLFTRLISPWGNACR
jgi:hypothetical protein